MHEFTAGKRNGRRRPRPSLSRVCDATQKSETLQLPCPFRPAFFDLLIESASFIVRDNPRRDRLDLPKLLRELKDKKPGEQLKEFTAQMQTRAELGVKNHDAALRLYDSEGKPRIVIRVDAQDNPIIEILDKKGEVIARMPPR